MSKNQYTPNPHRINRINDLVQKELMDILKRESNDPRLNNLNITGVEVSRDLSVAKIYYTDFISVGYVKLSESDADSGKNNDNNHKRNSVKKALDKASGFLRRELARRCDLRKTPELRFIYDKSIDQGSNIEDILRSVNKGSDDEQEGS
jgi:ribosome-binding factor A